MSFPSHNHVYREAEIVLYKPVFELSDFDKISIEVEVWPITIVEH